MRWLKISIYLILIYVFTGFSNQQLYFGSAQTDRRQDILKTYLQGSSLKNEASAFITTADRNNIDWKILPAIAMVESTGGKFTPSCAPFNPFGWSSSTSPCGFYRFGSFSEAIEKVGREIGNGTSYTKFQKTGNISDLANVYNENPQDWTWKVKYFEDKIK